MKLVEILARELGEWPSVDGVECGFIVQESDGELYTTHDKAPMHVDGNSWWRQEDDDGECGYLDPTVYMVLAEDWTTSIINREMWESERARIKGEKAMPKASKDGWIRHRGGKCPVEDRSTYINGRFRSGEQYHGPAYGVAWSHAGKPSDLMAWRPHKAAPHIEPAVLANVEAFNAKAEMPTAKYFDGPLQWRDRIREIDAARKEEEARHCTAMAAYNEERTSLVAKLKAEGFSLIHSDEPNSEVESVQDDIAQQDMSDPANWRVGDIFEITGQDSHEFPMGELVKLIVFENDHDESDGHRYAYLDGRDFWWVRDCNVRFHSRPI